jgi:hypothetical protein
MLTYVLEQGQAAWEKNWFNSGWDSNGALVGLCLGLNFFRKTILLIKSRINIQSVPKVLE